MRLAGLDQDALEQAAETLGGLLAPGHIVALEGEMGAGKTTFTRALARGMKVERPDRVCSPTFNICLVHSGPTPLVHIDLYRLAEDASPAFGALGLEDIIERAAEVSGRDDVEAAGAVVIEWADLWKGFSAGSVDNGSTAETLRIRIVRPTGESDIRNIEVEARGGRHTALLQTWATLTQGPAQGR